MMFIALDFVHRVHKSYGIKYYLKINVLKFIANLRNYMKFNYKNENFKIFCLCVSIPNCSIIYRIHLFTTTTARLSVN